MGLKVPFALGIGVLLVCVVSATPKVGDTCSENQDCFIPSRDNMECRGNECQCKTGFEQNGGSGDCAECEGTSDVRTKCAAYGPNARCLMPQKQCGCQDGYTSDSTKHCNQQVCSPLVPSEPVLLVHYPGLKADGRYSGAVVTFSCTNTSETTGGATSTCQADGTWSGPIPTCQPICTDAPEIRDATVVTVLTGNTYSATYTCVDGYIITGTTAKSQTVTCSNRAWPAVQCEAICNPPPAIQNGQVSYSISGQSFVATYTCASGYVVSSTGQQAATVSCSLSSERQWNVPTCVQVCPRLSERDNLILSSYDVNERSPGDTAAYTCFPAGNYVLPGTQHTGFTLECQLSSGVAIWVVTSPSGVSASTSGCVAKCDDLSQTIKFGTVSGGLGATEGATATITCKSGWVTEIGDPTMTLTCGENAEENAGEWSAEFPTCSRASGRPTGAGTGGNGVAGNNGGTDAADTPGTAGSTGGAGGAGGAGNAGDSGSAGGDSNSGSSDRSDGSSSGGDGNSGGSNSANSAERTSGGGGGGSSASGSDGGSSVGSAGRSAGGSAGGSAGRSAGRSAGGSAGGNSESGSSGGDDGGNAAKRKKNKRKKRNA